ncbi:MAG: hypothetical protein ACKVRP_01480 [Bacteroidota bacterium]
MKRDEVDVLLQLAYLEGVTTLHGGYERAVAKRAVPALTSANARDALQKRLESALAVHAGAVPLPLTVGAFLKHMRSEQALRPQELFARLGMSQNIYRMLEQDRISPLKISVASWKKFMQLFDVPGDVLVEMVRRTHQLVWFRPSFRTTLARYNSSKRQGMKAADLEHAATELYTRAKLTLPEEEEKKLAALLQALSQ